MIFAAPSRGDGYAALGFLAAQAVALAALGWTEPWTTELPLLIAVVVTIVLVACTIGF